MILGSAAVLVEDVLIDDEWTDVAADFVAKDSFTVSVLAVFDTPTPVLWNELSAVVSEEAGVTKEDVLVVAIVVVACVCVVVCSILIISGRPVVLGSVFVSGNFSKVFSELPSYVGAPTRVDSSQFRSDLK